MWNRPSRSGPSAITVASASISSSVRCAMRCRTSRSPAPVSSSPRISAEVSSHCWRTRVCSNRSEFCTAMPAAAASACDEHLVGGGEVAAAELLGEVEVAEHGVADPDGHAEERPHRRVVGREPHRRLVGAEVGHPQRARVDDQLPEQALALRQRADPLDGLRVHSHVQEPLDAARGAQHAERGVARLDEVDGRVHDAPQGRVEIEALGDGEHRVQEALCPVPRGDDLRKPVLDLAEQLVEPQTGQHAGGSFVHARHRGTWFTHRASRLARSCSQVGAKVPPGRTVRLIRRAVRRR